jgi:hypothetical protein
MAVPVCFLTAVVMGEIPRPAGESAGFGMTQFEEGVIQGSLDPMILGTTKSSSGAGFAEGV